MNNLKGLDTHKNQLFNFSNQEWSTDVFFGSKSPVIREKKTKCAASIVARVRLTPNTGE